MAAQYRRERKDSMTLQNALSEAHKIAFAPMMFQAVRTMIKVGLLPLICERKGVSREDILKATKLSAYAVGLMLDVALFGEIVRERDGKYFSTKLGQVLTEDRAIQANMAFMHDVCYQGAFSLDKSFETGKPEGLKIFGAWETIYQGLGSLPPQAAESWFNFDNYYSDLAFGEAVNIVLKGKPKIVYDIGGNTAKFDIALFRADECVRSRIIDLPPQLKKARDTLTKKGFLGRAELVPADILDSEAELPKGADAVWMSQFLDCFSPQQIVFILKKAKKALNPGGRVFILEPFIDRQNQVAALALINISLYFACMANGNSRMYRQTEMVAFIEEAGMNVLQAHQDLGAHSYTLLECIL
jgi:SAM-dependent methyltransferase